MKPVLDENGNVIQRYTPDDWRERESARAVVRKKGEPIEGEALIRALYLTQDDVDQVTAYFAAVKTLAGEGK